MIAKILTKLSCKLLLLIALGLGLTACAVPGFIVNTLSGTSSLVVTQTAAVSTSSGTATLIWNNPTHSANNSIVSINISYVGYETAIATVPTNNSAGNTIIDQDTTGYERLRESGGRDISYKVTGLNISDFYEFAIALNYQSGPAQKVELGSAKRVNVRMPTLIMPITGLRVNSNMPGVANLTWTNPVYSTPNQLEIQSVNISYNGYSTLIGGSVVDGSSGYVTLTSASFLRQNATVNYDLSGLTQARYYDFNVTLIYRGLGSSNFDFMPRTAIMLPAGPRPAVTNLTAESSGIYQATLKWDNPFYLVPIESVNISYSGYSDNTSSTPIPESQGYVVIDAMSAEANMLLANGIADVTHNLTGLSFATHYEFTVTLNYLDLGGNVPAMTSRIALNLPTDVPSAINPEAVVNAVSQTTVIWDNPHYHIPITSVNISYVGYTGAMTDSPEVPGSAGYKELNTNEFIARGAQGLSDVIMIMPPATATHYDFNITLTYMDGISNVSVIPGRFDVTNPTPAPTLVIPTATSTVVGRATVNWTNPDYPISIEAVTINYEGYNVPTAGVSVPEAASSVTHNVTEGNADLLQMGEQTLVINNLNQARYYDFTITLTYRAMVVSPNPTATTAARAEILLTAAPAASTPMAVSSAIGNATITWDNPAYPIPIESVTIAYGGFNAPTTGTVITGSEGEVTLTNTTLLVRGMTGISHTLSGLNLASHYEFSITLTYQGGTTSTSANSTRIAIIQPASDQLAPTVTITLLGNAAGKSANVPADQEVRVNVTATKKDGSNNLNVSFPEAVMSSSGCTANITGGTTRQYDGVDAGSSSVSVIYNVSPNNSGADANCGSFTFNATEGAATGSKVFSGIIRFFVDTDGDGLVGDDDNCPMIASGDQNNTDGDSFGDICDVDDDGDGLIEIYNATQLNMMRYNLAGTGLDDGNNDNDNATGGNNMGCGATTGDACNGYEQVADIDLNDLPDNAIPGHNWDPVGTCGISISCNTASGYQFFNGVFSGNNFTISNLLIDGTTTRYGVGLFGAINSTAQVRNVHILGGNITGATSFYVGGLVGYGVGATISNSSVTLDEISGVSRVGGLVGQGDTAIINSSVATVGSISGTSNSVGGLVGQGLGVTISASLVTVGSISGTGSINDSGFSVGGLVGDGGDARINFSVVTVGAISGTGNNVGGLIGRGNSLAIIRSSVATVGAISGADNVGGLVGFGDSATINSSVAFTNNITGVNNLGGLVGNGRGAMIISSLAVTDSINGTNNTGGLVGSSGLNAPASTAASYWDANVSFVNAPQLISNMAGSSQTTTALTNQTTFTGTDNIYAIWGDAYCNPNTGEYRATAPDTIGDYIRVWDLGEGDQYPAINCVKNFFSLAQQREVASRALAGTLPLVD